MVYVILRNSKVIQYNNAVAISQEGNSYVLQSEVKEKYFLVARIPMDVVERVEFGKPCAIMKERLPKKLKSYK